MNNPTFTRETTTVTYRVRIDGAEPMTISSWSKTLFRPSFAEVTFASDRDKPRVKLYGPNVKKDGSDGQNGHDRDLSEWDKNGRPDWYDALINQFRPHAEAAFR